MAVEHINVYNAHGVTVWYIVDVEGERVNDDDGSTRKFGDLTGLRIVTVSNLTGTVGISMGGEAMVNIPANTDQTVTLQNPLRYDDREFGGDNLQSIIDVTGTEVV